MKNISSPFLKKYTNFFEGSVFTFQFLNDKINNYVKKTICTRYCLKRKLLWLQFCQMSHILQNYFFGGHFDISGKIHHFWLSSDTWHVAVQCSVALHWWLLCVMAIYFLISIFWEVVFKHIIIFLLIFSLMFCFLCWKIWWISITVFPHIISSLE